MIFLCKLFTSLVTNEGYRVGSDKVNKYRQNVEQRFGRSISEIEQELEVAAIFVVFGVTFSSLTI